MAKRVNIDFGKTMIKNRLIWWVTKMWMEMKKVTPILT